MNLNKKTKKLLLLLLFCAALLLLLGELLHPYLWGKSYPSPLRWNGISIDIAYPYYYEVDAVSGELFVYVYNAKAPKDCKFAMTSFGKRDITLEHLTKKLSQWDFENIIHSYEEIDFKGYQSLLIKLKDFTTNREIKRYCIFPKRIFIEIFCTKQDDLKYFDPIIDNIKFMDK
ncbi:MAG: hypothetical protein HQL10_13415 [Nitrospirae bacterium]|nr:hypothetical protein [Nitrospirota bacterium]